MTKRTTARTPPQQPASSSAEPLSWVVVNTQPHKERYAELNLLRQNYTVYSPRLSKTIRHARQTRTELRSLFPGYLFVGIDLETTPWRPIASTFGVRRLVQFGDRLGLLPNDFVAALRSREIGGAIVRPAVPFEAGDDVRVVSGPFAGTIACVVDASDGDRVMILLELLQKEFSTTVPISAVRRIADHAEI